MTSQIQKHASHAKSSKEVNTEIFLGIGSNLNDPIKQIQSGLTALRNLLNKLECASWYRSKPLGPRNQPDFVNTVVKGLTSLSPQELREECQRIEHEHQRVKTEHWGPRTLDIDILYFGEMWVSTKELTIPHPEILRRPFVVIPLIDLIPSGITPVGDQIDRTRYDLCSLSRIDQ